MNHSMITVAVDFDPAHDEDVKSFLKNSEKDIRRGLGKTKIVHFMSINTVPYGEATQPRRVLLLELNIDGTTEVGLEKVVEKAGASLLGLFKAAGAPVASKALLPFLRQHRIEVGQGWSFSKTMATGLNYDGSPALTVARIKREAKLAKWVRKQLYECRGEESALKMLEHVRNTLWAQRSQKWAFVSEPAPFLSGGSPACLSTVPKIAGSAFTVLLWPMVLIAAVISWVPALVGIPPEWPWMLLLLFFAGVGILITAYLRQRLAITFWEALASLLFIAANVVLAIGIGLWLWHSKGSDLTLEWFAKEGNVLIYGSAGYAALASGVLLWISLKISNSRLMAVVAVGMLLVLAAFVSQYAAGRDPVAWIAPGLIASKAARTVFFVVDLLAVAVLWRVLRTQIILHMLFWVLVATSWPILIYSLATSGLSNSAAWVIIALFLITTGIAAAYGYLRYLEKSDRPDNQAPTAKHMAEILTRENQKYDQNHLFVVTPLKDGWFRRFTLRVGLWIVGEVTAQCGRAGFLNDIGSIHFARWVVLPNTSTLVFLSNYDGAWESYLEDFIEKAHLGLTGIWSNVKGFPRAANLFTGGAHDGDRFKHFARRKQRPTLFWYSAYPKLSLSRIRMNAAIRQGLSLIATEAEAADWLSCFGSAPLPPTSIEAREIPSLVFGGLSHLRYAACLIVKLSENEKDCKDWLSTIVDSVTHGDELPRDLALMVAFSRTGLQRLGLSDPDLETFPAAFQHGMAAEGRARVLGDDPENWVWGNDKHEADVVLLLYAKERSRLESEYRSQCSAIQTLGHKMVQRIRLKDMPRKGQPVREAFGFIDGISQPIIRGTRRWTLTKEHYHVVEPGEMILGYPDNRGYVPPSPVVSAACDPKNLLPAAVAAPQSKDKIAQISDGIASVSGASSVGVTPAQRLAPMRQRPNFQPVQSSGLRDFGRNGTFLVVRQIDQDRDAFEKFLCNAASGLQTVYSLKDVAPGHLQEWIAAKMVGRWRADGSSLVRQAFPFRDQHGKPLYAAHKTAEAGSDQSQGCHQSVEPDSEPARTNARLRQPDNDFLFGVEDPAGLRCPFGAHIRRTNPRDSFAPGSEAQLAITNRHRILRVGRSYDPQEKIDSEGLLFMCLNADIERQFEFVQQTWVMGRNFHGLENEIDPMMAPQDGERFTIPTADGPLQVSGLQQFTTVKGGGYFFLPGRKALHFLAGRRAVTALNAVGHRIEAGTAEDTVAAS